MPARYARAPRAVEVAAVSVIKRNLHWIILYLALYLLLYSSGLLAAVLPAERGDGMHHRYDGGGVTVDGPAVLTSRKRSRSTPLTVTSEPNTYTDP